MGARECEGSMAITPERWLDNLLLVFDQIANKEVQERRWLAPARFVRPRRNSLLLSEANGL
jgi:hypothetical protein